MAPGELISNFKNAFANYTNTFKSAPYNEDPSIERTIQHTERVVENILVLARSLDLTENELHIAEIAARFHDIGRLWLILPENSETKITDHAEASIEYLNTNSTFRELDESAQSIILNVIRNHNKPDLPKKEGESVLFYVKLLRDADKLDTWRSTTEYLARKGTKPTMAVEMNLSDKVMVTPALCRTIIDGGIPNKTDIVTFNDFIIFQMSWIFDLNFKKSFQLLNQKQYIRYLYDSLPKNDSVIEIYRMIRIYIENQL